MRIRLWVSGSIFILIFFILSSVYINPAYLNDPNDTVSSSIDVFEDSNNKQLEEPVILKNLNKIDGFFTKNRGQVENDSVRYYIQGKGVWFLDDGVVFELRDEISIDSRESEFPFDPMVILGSPEPQKYKSVVLKLNFEGANQIIPIGQGLLQHRSNFFYGNISSKWRIGVPNYREVIYENIYDNIDLRYYITSKGLKYDFIVHPKGSINDIKLKYKGALDLYINNCGELKIKTLLGDIGDFYLLIYQKTENNKNEIEGKFNLLTHFTYGFKVVGEYDKHKDLIIDPLVYSTYLGGSFYDCGKSLVIDTNNNIYVTGETKSNDFPNTTGAYDTSFNGVNDVVVFKFNQSDFSLVYSTFIGGNKLDAGTDIAIDSCGNTVISGITESTNFPKTTNVFDTTYNGRYDVFVLKLNQTGTSLFYSTFVGGINDEITYNLALDSSGYVYVVGYTSSNDFPYTTNAFDTTYNGDWDVFMFKLNPSGTSLIYSTFVGGTNRDVGLSIVIDSYYNVYLTGETNSSDFPKTTNAYDNTYNGDDDVFVIKLNLTQVTLMYSSFFGGSDFDRGWNIAIDSSGNIYVTGTTLSVDFPNTTGAYDNSFNGSGNEWLRGDVFVFKLDSTNLSLVYSTYIGGSDYEIGRCIMIDSNNNAYVTGETKSYDFPSTTDALDTIHNGEEDVFVIKLNPCGSSLLYSTFIGGSAWDWGWDIAIDLNENIYVTGWTNSTDFPITSDAYDNTCNGAQDIFVLKFNITANISIPSVLDLKMSKSSILRTNSVRLYSNATDIEDLERDLTPVFIEYRDPNELVWNGSYFSNLKYNNSRWEATFTPSKDAVLGLYDFRIMFNDTDKLFSRWFYLNDSLIVLNNIPSVIDMLLSKYTSLKNETIFIWVNGTDIEDDERNLSIELEIRSPGERSWDNIHSIEPKYINNSLEINFTIPFNSSFGYYDLRVRVIDSDGDHSDWLYANDSLLVYNARPKVIDIGSSNNSVYRTNSVFLYINATDHETSESMLKFCTQYKQNGETEWTELIGEYSQSNERWETEFITTKKTTLGLYDFRVRCEDNESASSDWVYRNNSIEVLNNPPGISNTLDDIHVGLSPVLVDLSLYGSDIEDPCDTLTWVVNETRKYRYIETIAIIKNNTLKIIPQLNVSGHVDIELILKDKDGGIDIRSNITVLIDSLITEQTPKVTLLSPPNSSVVSTLTPTLEWKLEYSGDELINFTIFLNKTPALENIISSNVSATSYILETELEDATTYYWQVIPRGGVCLSEPFCFTVNLSYKPDYKINLTSEKDYVKLHPGSKAETNLTVRNDGLLEDMIELEHNSGTLQNYTYIDRVLVQLPSNAETILKLTIMIPADFEIGVYNISLAANSLNDVMVSDDVTITVEVAKSGFTSNYRVNISVSPELVEIKQGGAANVTLSILNFGDLADKYDLSSNSDQFSSDDVFFESYSVSLNASEIKAIKIQIHAPENIKLGEYNITFNVGSNYVTNKTTLTVLIKTKKVSSGPGHGIDNTVIFIIAGIIILIIILIVLIILRKRFKSAEEGSVSGKISKIEPEDVPKPELEPEPKFKPEQPETASPETAPPETAPPETVPSETAPSETTSTETVPHEIVQPENPTHGTAPPITMAPETEPSETAQPEIAPSETASPETKPSETESSKNEPSRTLFLNKENTKKIRL